MEAYATGVAVPEWMKDASARAIRLWAVLVFNQDRHGTEWEWDTETIAQAFGWSEKTVARALAELVARGAISVEGGVHVLEGL